MKSTASKNEAPQGIAIMDSLIKTGDDATVTYSYKIEPNTVKVTFNASGKIWSVIKTGIDAYQNGVSGGSSDSGEQRDVK
jgi:hypothetical protein